MKTFITFFVLVLALSSISLGQMQYGIFEFTGTSTGDNQFNAVTAQPYFGSFSTFTRTGATWASGADVFWSSNWPSSPPIDNNKYVGFSFTLNSGYNFNGISLTLVFNSWRSGGPLSRGGEVWYRYGSNSLAYMLPWTPNEHSFMFWPFPIPTAPLNATFLEIRFYAYGMDTLAFDNVKLIGNYDPTPIELTSFTANVLNNNVVLNWQTATETNNYGFDIERASSSSSAIQIWEKIGSVNGSGNSNSPKSYSFVDKTATHEKYTYRLKQIDANGAFSYSKEVEVDMGVPTTFALQQNYPNPFNPTTIISYQVPTQSLVQLDVFNSIGEIVETLVNEVKEVGYYDIEFNAATLSSGTYFYRIKTGDFTAVKKMMIMR